MSSVVLRRFNRTWSQRVGVLEESYLGTGRPLAVSRLLFEIEDRGSAVADLRARLGLDSGYLSRLLRRLQADGSVVLEPGEEDARRRTVVLTAQGATERAQLESRSARLADDLLDGLTVRQQQRLDAALLEAELLIRVATIAIEEVPVDAAVAREAVGRYFGELGERFGFVAGAPDREGRFFVAVADGAAVACGGVRTLPDGRAELKRLWVDASWRGAGLGGRMLRHLEAVAADDGHAEVVLDTKAGLTEAVALYERAGWQRIDRYNDNPEAELFFVKRLSRDGA
jgi:DNA-binding MarR family transcriptional regulator/ribosomal protein S18 acetylase RimI-like enzyme